VKCKGQFSSQKVGAMKLNYICYKKSNLGGNIFYLEVIKLHCGKLLTRKFTSAFHQGLRKSWTKKTGKDAKLFPQKKCQKVGQNCGFFQL
jgi:hypothetical protein